MKRAFLLVLLWAALGAGQEIPLSPRQRRPWVTGPRRWSPCGSARPRPRRCGLRVPASSSPSGGGRPGDGPLHPPPRGDGGRGRPPVDRRRPGPEDRSRGAAHALPRPGVRGVADHAHARGRGGVLPGVVWPEGRGYVYLVGGAPRVGELLLDGKGVPFVLVDGDLDGTYGSKGDFFAVDVDGDGVIHGDPDGHERFALGEVFTVGERSFRVSGVDPQGKSVRLAPTGYVPGKPPHPRRPRPRPPVLLVSRREGTFPLRPPGKVVLLDFWATWCGPCMEELPKLLELYATHRDQGFEIVGVSLDTSERDLRAVLADRG